MIIFLFTSSKLFSSVIRSVISLIFLVTTKFINSSNPKCVRAINKNTKEVLYFGSITAVQKYLGINNGTVKRVCEGVYGRKSGISNRDGCSYTFEYIEEEELPVDHIKSANIRPKRVSDEDKKKNLMKAIEKWQNKEFKCPNCNKTYKNNYKYLHKKHCNNSQQ